jgi:hypothetical protein
VDLVIGLMLGVGLALVATHRRGSPIIERYYHADQKFYERWQAYRKLERLIESDRRASQGDDGSARYSQ